MNDLEKLLNACTVKLTVPNRSGWGTGFFVAPGYILTCAHVVQASADRVVSVQHQDSSNNLSASIERLLPNPYDLALLKIQFPPLGFSPPCVYLGDQIHSRDPLYIFGYPDRDFNKGCPVTFNCEGLTGDEPPLIKLSMGQVRPGMSGSPLLNQRTKKVCGIIKFTRDRSSDLGGGAILTLNILTQLPELGERQRLFHESDRRWSQYLEDITKTTDDNSFIEVSAIVSEVTNAIRPAIQERCGFMRILDMVQPIRLNHIYTKVNVLETVVSRNCANIQDFLLCESPTEDDFKRYFLDAVPTEKISGLDAVSKYSKLIILGKPGSGKQLF
jgi:hypothetical protein